ncbi:MAG: four helix bundle protein [Cyclobacteriaceae bacterium]|nr:four helix bundle protein [Cyclobacteriaceae bacterium]
MQTVQSYRDLVVWQKAMTFAKEVIELADQNTSGRKLYRLLEQIQSSSSSVPMNIAEGLGRKGTKEFIQFLYIARGSLYETITLLELFKDLNWTREMEYNSINKKGEEIGRMLMGLIKRLSEK